MKNASVSKNPKDNLSFITDFDRRIPLAYLEPFTTIDYPNHLAAVLFLQGCDWRCRYCFNSELWPKTNYSVLSWNDVEHFLQSRHELLDAVVFSGGEPTLHPDLEEAIQHIKRHGYKVGLHTTGMYSEKLQKVLPLCDWIGMDIKAPFDHYERITRIPNSGQQPRQSANLILESKKPYEFRTTYHPALLSEEDLIIMATMLAQQGATEYVVQAFQAKGCCEAKLAEIPLPHPLLSHKTYDQLKQLFPRFHIR